MTKKKVTTKRVAKTATENLADTAALYETSPLQVLLPKKVATKKGVYVATLPPTHKNAFTGNDTVRCLKCGRLPQPCKTCKQFAAEVNAMSTPAKSKAKTKSSWVADQLDWLEQWNKNRSGF